MLVEKMGKYWGATAVLLVACGGSVTSDPFGTTGTTGSSADTSAASSGSGGASSGGTGGTSASSVAATGVTASSVAASSVASSGTGPSDCDALVAKVEAALQAAQKCCAVCDSIQCTGSVPGVCCPATVASADSAETQAYLSAYKAFVDAGCVVPCPAVPCPETPSFQCMPSGTCA